MRGRMFLIHWNLGEVQGLAKGFRAQGWKVDFEYEDGARAGKQIRARPPDVVVIYLTRLPSHGRETAHGLRALKATREIPIVFVDGLAEKVAATRAKVPDAIYITTAGLRKTLARFARPR